MTESKKKKGSIFDGFLNTSEKVGNKLPHPITIFCSPGYSVSSRI